MSHDHLSDALLHSLNSVRTTRELRELTELPGRQDIGELLAQRILTYRDETGGFKLLTELRRVKGIGRRRFESILEALSRAVQEEEKVSESPAVLRARLAIALRTFLTPREDAIQIRGSDPIGAAIEQLSGAVDSKFRDYVVRVYEAAVETEAITPDTRVADVVLFPQIATGIEVGAPVGVLDPASLPGIGMHGYWFRARGTVFVESVGVGRIQLLTPDGWSAPLEFEGRIAVQRDQSGVCSRHVREGVLGPLGLGRIMHEAAPAVRITCGAGVRGSLTRSPVHLDGHVRETLPSVPLGWQYPAPEIWINPRPEWPFGPVTDSSDPFLPGDVVIGGGAATGEPPPEDERDDTVVIGTFPRVMVAVKRPWPWPWGPFGPWPRPWPPLDDDWKAGEPDDGWYIAIEESIAIGLSVQIAGCRCIRRPGISKYVGEPSIEGGAYKWFISDEEIATIEGPDNQKEVRVRSKKIGKVTLTLHYTYAGLDAGAVIGISVIYHKFTPRNTPGGEILAVPVFQHAPQVRIAQQQPSFDVDTIEPEKHRARFLFNLSGQLGDALVDIEEVEVLAGDDFKRQLPRKANEYGRFNDTGFEAKKIEVWGPGRSYVRVRAKNSVEHYGTDTLDISIKLNPVMEDIITSREEDLARLHERNAAADTIQAAEESLQRAWRAALENPEVEFGYLTHTDNVVRLIPQNEKWSIAVEDDGKAGMADVNTGAKERSIPIAETRKNLLAPKGQPRNYFLVDESYKRDRVTYDKDGLLLGVAGEPATITYVDDCCAHEVAQVGVEFVDLPAVKHVKRTEGVKLLARGKPDQFLGATGLYTWTVAAHPAGADFRFEPENPKGGEARFHTDTPGVYTFKVEYSLLGAESPWTYAIADCQVLFDIEAVVRVHRLGRYNGDIAMHRDRPLHRERTVAEQPGAEILVSNKDGGSLGQDLDVQVYCAQELVLADTLVARALFNDDNDDAYRDYKLRLDGAFRFHAQSQIRSPRPIKRLLIMGVRYGNLPAHRGDAVWLDVRVRPLAPPVLDLQPATPAATSPHSGPVVLSAVTEPDPHMSGGDGEEQPNPRVNLLLRTRDLGDAEASHAVVALGDIGAVVNLTNGNQFFELSLFESFGAWLSLTPVLTYNSKAATFAEAVKLYGKLNGKDADALEKEFGPDRLGPGWSLSTDMAVREYVDPDGGIENPILHKCAEIRMPDGNRISFQEVSPAVYHVRSEAETIGANPDAALALVLTKLSDGNWQLEDLAGMQWIFDEAGRLEEQSDPRIRLPGRSLKALRWKWSDTDYRISDSSDRVTTCTLENGRVTEIEAPDTTKYTLHYDDGQVAGVTLPEQIAWSFEYGEHSLMTRIVPPEGHDQSITHYLGAAVETVPEVVARDFWGRVARIQFGDRRYSIRYDARSDTTQRVDCYDPEDHEWRYTYDAMRQACDSIEYVNAYSSMPWRRLSRWQYRGASKAMRNIEDLHGHRTAFTYQAAGVGRAEARVSLERPGTIMQQWTPGAPGLVRDYTDEAQAVTTFEHEPDRQVKSIVYPAVPVIGFTDLSRSTRVPSEAFTYDDAGRVETHRDVLGVLTTYEYDDDTRDPHRTGLPTAIGHGSFREEFAYDVMGRLLSVTDAFGLSTTNEYDDRGRLKRVSSGSFHVNNDHDGFDRLRKETDNVATSNYEYDDYGDPKSVTNRAGDTRTYLERDRNGNLLAVQQEDGAVFRYTSYDALGRWRGQTLPGVARQGADGLSTPDMPQLNRDYVDTPAPFALLGMPTTRVLERSGTDWMTWHFDAHGRLVAEEGIVGAHTTISLTDYDVRGNPISETLIDGADRITLGVKEWDAAGNLVAATAAGVTIRYCTARDGDGIYEVELMPRQSNHSGRAPAVLKRFDDNNRPRAEYNGEGRQTVAYEYSADHRVCTIRSADPAQMSDNDTLIESQIIEYNERGQVVQQTDPRTGETTEYTFDAAGRLETARTAEGTTRFVYNDLDAVKEIHTEIPAVLGTVAVAGGPGATPPGVTSVPFVVRKDYDGMGRLTRRGPDGAAETYTYDALGRVITVKRAGLGGGRTSVEEIYYDTRGEESARWFAPGEYVRYRRNHERRQVRESWHSVSSPRQATYEYDALGNVVRQWTNTHPYHFEQRYDARGRRVSQTVHNNGNVMAAVTVDYGTHVLPDYITCDHAGGSRSATFHYDSSLRTVGVEDTGIGSGGRYSFVYNRAGARIAIVRPSSPHARTEYVHLPQGGIHRVRHRLGKGWDTELLTTFDPASIDRFGNPWHIRHVYSEAGVEKRVPQVPESEQHEFDAANRLVASTITGTASGLYTQLFGDWGPYLAVLLPISLQGIMNTLALLTPDTRAEVKKKYYFDRHNRRILELTQLTPDLDRPDVKQYLIHHFRYGAGQAVKEDTQEWYDVRESQPRYINTRYLYDSHGRRRAEIQTIRDLGGRAWARITTNDYDFGNKPHTTREFEKRGNQLHALSAVFSVYDPEDRLIHVRQEVFEESKVGQSGEESQLAGDFADESDFQNVPIASVAQPRSTAINYVYAGNDLVALLDGDGNSIEEYLTGPGMNARLAVNKRRIGAWRTADYYNDHRDTAIALTGADGEVLEHYPQPGTYGEALQQVPEAVHAGMWSSLGRVFVSGVRNYDAATRQFTAPDPLGVIGGMNVYSFAGDNPVSFRDRSGAIAETVWDIASIGIGWRSLLANVAAGNFSGAVIDGIGIGVDVVATAIPGVPGGAGVTIKGYRVADAAIEAAEAARKFDRLVVLDFPPGLSEKAIRNATDFRTEVLTGAALGERGVRSVASRVRVLRSAMSKWDDTLDWKQLSEKTHAASKTEWQEIIGTGGAIKRIEAQGWRVEGAVKYGSNHGIDLVFRGIDQNLGRIALAEAKHSRGLGALKTFSRIRQGSLLYFFTRAFKAKRYDVTRAMAAGQVTFYGYFHRRKKQLVEFLPNNFFWKANFRRGSKAFRDVQERT